MSIWGALKIQSKQLVKNVQRTGKAARALRAEQGRESRGCLPSLLHVRVPETEYTECIQLEMCLDSLSKLTEAHYSYHLNSAWTTHGTELYMRLEFTHCYHVDHKDTKKGFCFVALKDTTPLTMLQHVSLIPLVINRKEISRDVWFRVWISFRGGVLT